MEPHIFSENIIDEISLHLYKYPRSAIKELITNGLDQQPAEARIKIDFHEGENDAITIEDFGTGIENLKDFQSIGRGFKQVGDEISSYEEINPNIGGNKGFGKMGSRMLSGSRPEPLVVFNSNRPRKFKADGTLRYNEVGMRTTLKRAGYDTEFMNSSSALDHPGVKVEILNAKYELLPSETRMMKYISQWFALRIANGAKILFDLLPVCVPDGFNPKSKELFTLSDGFKIKGNIRPSNKPSSDNIWVYNKNIYVDSLSFEHKCTGWINDDFIVPTTSREAIEETARWIEIQEKLREYLDKNFEKPNKPKLGRMGKEKEKKDAILKLLKYRKEKMRGLYDENGLPGEITGGVHDKKWVKKTGIKLTNSGGDDQAAAVIPIGPGVRKPGVRHGGTGTKPGIEKGGDHDIITQEQISGDIRNTEGLVKPDLKILFSEAGFDRPMSYMNNTSSLVLNVSWPQARKAYNAKSSDHLYLLAPVVAQAVVNFDKTEHEEIDADTWQKRYQEYYRILVGD